MKILNFLKGKKTFIIAICGLVYGLGTNDLQTVILCLGMMGLKLGQLGK